MSLVHHKSPKFSFTWSKPGKKLMWNMGEYMYLHSSSTDCTVFKFYIKLLLCFQVCVWALKKSLRIIRHSLDCKGQFFTTPIVDKLIFFCSYTVISMNLSALWVSAIKNWTFVTSEQWFSCNHTRSCQVVAYQKQKTKEYVKFLALKVVTIA